ncbi:MAG: glutathione S-transferase family protein [Pseudomonadota bacterium]
MTSAAALRLYWSPDSANLVIRQALERFELPFEGLRIDRGKLQHKAPDYLAKNPQGLLPVLEDGDLVLFETGAILLHLAERTGLAGPEGPELADPKVRGALQKWLFYLSNTPHADLRAAFYTHRYVGDEAAIPVVWAGLARRFRGHLDLLEAALPEKGGLLGPVTVLDTYLSCLIRWAQLYGGAAHRLSDLETWPKLYHLMREIEAMPAIRRAFAAEYIQDTRPITRPERPVLPEQEITGE